MMFWLIGVVVIVSAIEWYSEIKGQKKLMYFVKPAAMVVLIAWVILNVNAHEITAPQITWFIIGLCLCLVGDVFLMLPPEKGFLPGLVAFLLGHIGYILGLWVFPMDSLAVVPAIFLALILLVVGVMVFRRLAKGIRDSGQDRMVVPVGVYSVVISLMVFSAAYTFLNPNWATQAAALVAFGALSFYISDILNAWLRFVGPLNKGRMWVMSTYHLGQIGLAVGAVLHFAGVFAN